MTFGLSFVNNQNVVVIDSIEARMCVIYSGNLVNDGSSNWGSSNFFPAPITTQEPPLIFIRPTNPTTGFGSVELRGSAGNWTGFYLSCRSAGQFGPAQWFVTSFGAQTRATFGLRLWAADASPIFDSGTPSAIFTQAFQAWTYISSAQGAQGDWTNLYNSPASTSLGDYIMINNFGMNLLSGSPSGRSINCSWNYTTGVISATTNDFNNPYDFHLSALFAKPTG